MQARDCFQALRDVINGHGHEFETGPVDERTLCSVSEELALPRELGALYAHNGPAEDSSVAWVVEDMSLFSFGELPAAQEGYRWTERSRRVRASAPR